MNIKHKMLLSFIGAGVITCLYFLWAYQTVPFVYDIVDDIMMRDAAAGVTTGTPDGHLIYIKFVLGQFICFLYQFVPGFDWYGILMLCFCCVSLMVVLYRGFVMNKSILFKFGYVSMTLLLFTCIGLRQLCGFQFTVSAGLIGSAGLFLFLTCHSEDKFQVKAEEIAALICLLCSFCVRDTVFLLLLPAAGVSFCYRYGYMIKAKFPFRLRHWKVPVALLCGCILILGIELFAYRSKEWRTYLRYNTYQVDVMDYYGIPSYDEYPTFYKSHNITEHTAVNIGRYSLHLAKDVYPENMEALAEKAQEEYFAEYSFLERFSVGLKKLYCSMMKKEVLLVVCAVIVLFSFLWCESRGNQKKQFFICILNAAFLVCWLYLCYKARIVDRVTFTLLFIQLFTYLGMLGIFEKETLSELKSFHLPNICTFLCAALIFTGLAHMQVTELQETNQQRQIYNQQFIELKRELSQKPESIYFVTTFTTDQSSDIFTLRRQFEFSNMMEIGTWASFSELDNQKLQTLGVTDMEQTILNNDNCYVISSVNIDYMDRYFTAKYGNAYAGRTLIDTKNYGNMNFEIYKFSLKD